MGIKPPLMWAQDHSKVYLTIKLQDLEGEKIEITPNAINFNYVCPKTNEEYEMNLELFEEVAHDDAETKISKFGRYTQVTIRKKNTLIWWPRLAKTTSKLHHVKIDWERWVDEPESDPDDGSIPINNTPGLEEYSSSDEDDE